MDHERRKTRVALLSVASNSILVILKLVIGFMVGSVSVISEAIHSGMDLIAALIALYSVKTSGKPADEEHPFGHGKIENLSGTVEALLIFLAAAWIIYESIKKFIHPEPMGMALLGVGIMFVSAMMNFVVSQMLFKVGRETDSIALQADGWHLRTDVYTSAGVMAGLGLIWLGQRFYPGYKINWIDPLCAIAVALFIIKAAYNLTQQSARDLLDTNLPEEEKWIQDLIRSNRPIIRGYHYLRTRKAGHMRFIEFHVQLDSDMSVRMSHALSQQLSRTIREHLPNSTVTIHIEPCTGECSEKCLAGCFFTDVERYDMLKKMGSI
jgi:cation diffusion facilitator family transporter